MVTDKSFLHLLLRHFFFLWWACRAPGPSEESGAERTRPTPRRHSRAHDESLRVVGSEGPAQCSTTASSTEGRGPVRPWLPRLSRRNTGRRRLRPLSPGSPSALSQLEPLTPTRRPERATCAPRPVRAPPRGRSRGAPGHSAGAGSRPVRPGGPGFPSFPARSRPLLFPPTLPARPPAFSVGPGGAARAAARAVGPWSHPFQKFLAGNREAGGKQELGELEKTALI